MSNITTLEATPTQQKSSVVFTSGSTIHVNAPAEKVFAAILDTRRYGEWNSWCPSLTFEQDREIEVNSQGTLHCHMEAQNREYDIPVTVIELSSTPQVHTFAWRGGFLPSWAAVAERVQTVIPSADGASCEVRQWESMSGWASYVLKYLMGIQKQLDEANIRYVTDLKRFSEASN